jgi:hypothetical protein
MTTPTPTNPLDAYKAMKTATQAAQVNSREALEAEVIQLAMGWVQTVPDALLEDVKSHFGEAAKQQALSNDPRSWMLLFSAASAAAPPSTNGTQPLGLGAGTGNTNSTNDNGAGNTLNPEQQELLAAFEGATPHAVRTWADWFRRSLRLSGDAVQGFPNLVEDVLDGKTGINLLGEPLANDELKRVQKDFDVVEAERDQLKLDLAAEKAKVTTTTGGVPDGFRDAAYELIQSYYRVWGQPIPVRLTSTDADAIQKFLEDVNNGIVGHATATKAALDNWVAYELKVASLVKQARIALRDEVKAGMVGKSVDGKDKVSTPLAEIANMSKPPTS